MQTQNYLESSKKYQESIAALYGGTVTSMAERGEGNINAAPDLADRAQAVIDRSQELGQAAAANLEASDPDQRELAQLQLLAAAAIDLHVANDLVQLAEDVPSDVAERGATLPGAITELRAILDVDPNAGMSSLMIGAIERAASPSDPEEARQALRDAVEAALIDIRDGAASIGQATLNNLFKLPTAAIEAAAKVAIDDVMAKLKENVVKLVNKAVSLIALAVDKILEALGKDVQDEARQKAAEWLKDLQEGTLFATLLDKLYEPERIRKDIDEQITAVPNGSDAARFNTASQQIGELAQRFNKQTKTITLLLSGLAYVTPWIMGVEPWGPLALTAGYSTLIGYIVYAGGDHADWFRTGSSGRLNFVPGVRTVVRQSLIAP
jgi:hypothetical protein